MGRAGQDRGSESENDARKWSRTLMQILMKTKTKNYLSLTLSAEFPVRLPRASWPAATAELT